MEYRQYHFLQICTILVILAGCAESGQFITAPSNVSRTIGGDAVLDCRVRLTTGEHLEWSEFISSHKGRKIYDSRRPNNIIGNKDKFEVNGTKAQTGEGTHNLIIKNVVTMDGGSYAAKISNPNNDVSRSAEMLVFVNPRIVFPQALRENRTGKIICSAEFGGALRQHIHQNHWPSLTVTLDDNLLSGEDNYEEGVPGHRVHKLSKNVSLAVEYHHNGRMMRCIVSTQNPAFSLTKEQKLDVKYKVRDISIAPRSTGTPLTISVGEHINCTAFGNPEPSFKWTPVPGKVPTVRPGQPPLQDVNNFQLEITEAMIGQNEWECQASNRIGTEPRTNRLTSRISFRVVAATARPIESNANIPSPWLPLFLVILLSWCLKS